MLEESCRMVQDSKIEYLEYIPRAEHRKVSSRLLRGVPVIALRYDLYLLRPVL